jgi:hypothetical protein
MEANDGWLRKGSGILLREENDRDVVCMGTKSGEDDGKAEVGEEEEECGGNDEEEDAEDESEDVSWCSCKEAEG